MHACIHSLMHFISCQSVRVSVACMHPTFGSVLAILVGPAPWTLLRRAVDVDFRALHRRLSGLYVDFGQRDVDGLLGRHIGSPPGERHKLAAARTKHRMAWGARYGFDRRQRPSSF